MIDRCHERGIRVGLYMRGIEQHALYRSYFEDHCRRDYDGLYVDWSSPYNMGWMKASHTHFSAYAYFQFTRQLRRRVGERGFLIAHSGSRATMLALAVFDAYLPGEYRTQTENFFNSPDESVHHGFASCCGTNPISGSREVRPNFISPRAVAYCAGLGLAPEAGMLSDYAEVLWKIWSSVPMEKAYHYNSLTENVPVVSSSNPDFHTSVYKVSRDLVLLVTANLGRRGSTTLSIDMPALGLAGAYSVTEMRGETAEVFTEVKRQGTWKGTIQTGAFAPYEFRGYRLERLLIE
jgi:hypothetical protein